MSQGNHEVFECGGSCTSSKDIAVAEICKMFGREKIHVNRNRPMYQQDCWEKNSCNSKSHLCMEIHAMNKSAPCHLQRTPTSPFSEMPLEKI
jgi:hypothetical protein